MNIGSTYYSQGMYDEAIAQYERALRIKEKAFGADHINTGDIIFNIGLLFKGQGDSKLARSQLSRAYQIFKTELGELHPHTQKALSILQAFDEDKNREGSEGRTREPQYSMGKENWKRKLKKLFS